MKKGKLYGVGVGVGDKELITLKALKVLEKSDIIAVPKMKNGKRTAYGIIEEYVDGKEIIDCFMPMTKDIEKLTENYEKTADMLEEYLKMGKTVAFVTLGDPSIYSTYMQINSIICLRSYETEIIPGVTSFCASAAKLNISLCERDEPLIIIPASYKGLNDSLKLYGTKVIMKSNGNISEIKDILNEQNLTEKSFAVQCCGMENEKIFNNINEMTDNYFSVIVVKE